MTGSLERFDQRDIALQQLVDELIELDAALARSAVSHCAAARDDDRTDVIAKLGVTPPSRGHSVGCHPNNAKGEHLWNLPGVVMPPSFLG
jgi:hypothetical protein